jgi:catechol 2,3-dioxygenase-like lactoylglutathione lyase family enzyme
MSDSALSLELYTTIIRVRNLERSVEWYQNVLGLKQMTRDLHYRLVELAGEKGQRIALRELNDGKPVATGGLRSTYVVFMTPDVDEVHARLERQGHKVEPIQDHPGVRLFWLYDPDNHPLCILQFVIDWDS